VSERTIPHVRRFLGQRLRALRKFRNLTQRTLGEKAGLSGKFLGEVERGDKSISIDSLYRISVALQIPLRLLTSVGTSPESVPHPDAERIFALVLHPPAGQRPPSVRGP
jgi:transcriptional regulator with XRE-family HTH domain